MALNHKGQQPGLISWSVSRWIYFALQRFGEDVTLKSKALKKKRKRKKSGSKPVKQGRRDKWAWPVG